MSIQASHNGGRLQINLGNLQGWGDYPYIDLMKGTQSWSVGLRTNDRARPDDFSAMGLPNVDPTAWSGNWSTVNKMPLRLGDWIIDWVGDITLSGLGFAVTAVSGSLSGVNGRYVFTPNVAVPQSLQVIITRINEAVPFTSLRLYHADDEALLDAGGMFNPTLINMLRAMGVGIIRGGNYLPMNETNMSKWVHRKPTGYFSSSGMYHAPDLYCGETTNVGDDYSITLPVGVTFEDKDIITVRFNASASGDNATLDFGDGVWPIKTRGGNAPFSTERPGAGLIGSLYRDDELGVLCKWGGDAALGDYFILNKMPFEDYLRFCAEVGAHIWLPMPAWVFDPITDFPSSFMSLHKSYTEANNCTWMKSVNEGSNETWNEAGPYPQTQFAKNKSNAKGWGANVYDEYGKWMSELGQAAEAVYGVAQKRIRYRVVAGIQTFADFILSSQIKKVTSPLYVAAAGSAAYNHITDICTATYFNPTISLNLIAQRAVEYDVADTPTKAQILATYLATCLVDGTVDREAFGIPNFKRLHAFWKDNVAAPYGLGLLAYEGGISFVEVTDSANLVGPITGITKAANAEVTVGNTGFGVFCPPVGFSVPFASIGGMTEMNGLTGVVTAVTASNKFTVDIDSTGFTAYTSGGTATYTNLGAMIKTLALDGAAHSDARTYNLTMFQEFVAAGGDYPSYLQLCGPSISTPVGGSQWRNKDFDIYDATKFSGQLAAEDWFALNSVSSVPWIRGGQPGSGAWGGGTGYPLSRIRKLSELDPPKEDEPDDGSDERIVITEEEMTVVTAKPEDPVTLAARNRVLRQAVERFRSEQIDADDEDVILLQ